MGLAEFSVKRRVTITMIVSIILVIGGISFSKIGFDLLPEIESPTLFIMTTYSGVAPEDMENLITKPVEEAVATIKGVKKLSSFSQEGVSVVNLQLEWGTNLDVAAQDVRDVLNMMKDFMPEDASEPTIMKFSTEMMPIMFYAVTSEALNTYQLQKLIKKVVKPRMEKLDGVAAVTPMGGEEREIAVNVDVRAAQSKGLSLNDIVMMLRTHNINLPGGYIQQPHKEFLVRAVGEYKSIEEIRNTVVGIGSDGSTVRLKDIAEVKNRPVETRAFSRIQGKDGIMLIISKQSGANPLKVSRRIAKEMEKIKSILPEDVKFHMFFDQGEIVNRITSRTGTTALVGGILAVLMIFIFLRDPRPTLTIALAIPLSILAAFIPIYAIGYTLNLMTLGGFALGIGMLVDNAVVVIENIFRHLEQGKDKNISAITGARQVQNAIIASTLTTVVVFVPMLFAEGIPGKIAKALASTVAFSLLGSLFVALTIIPMLASVLFKEKTQQQQVKRRGRVRLKIFSHWQEGKLITAIKNVYEPILRWVLCHRAVVIVFFFALFGISVWLISLLGAEFLPKTDHPFVNVELKLPVGSSIDETKRISQYIERAAIELPEVLNVGAWGGLSETTRYDVAMQTAEAGVNYAQVGMRLKRKIYRKKTSYDIQEEIRKGFPHFENVKIGFPDMNAQMLGLGSEKSVSIKIFGDDLTRLKAISKRVSEEIKKIKGIEDVDTTFREGLPELSIKIDRQKAGALGLVVGQISKEVEIATKGIVATRFRKGGEEFNIRVRLKDEQRDDIEDIKAIPIKTPMNSFVPLGNIAEIKQEVGPLKILRENQMRLVKVEANTSKGRDLRSIIREVKHRLKQISSTFPEGYFYDFGGEYERMVEYFKFIGYALILALLLIYMVMAAQFESFSQPFIIMFTVPLCLIGVFLFLFLTGTRFNLPSGLGVVVLIGVAVNNGIVMIDYINQLRREGKRLEEAIIEGAKTRLRPIFITTGTTVIGMLPMALDRSEGSEMRAPLALAVMGGLLTSTLLTLILIPTVYHLLASIGLQLGGEKR